MLKFGNKDHLFAGKLCELPVAKTICELNIKFRAAVAAATFAISQNSLMSVNLVGERKR